MAGIVSYGAYLPRLRLERMAVMMHMGWLAPGLFGSAQGERTMCNWDEDSLTMAVAAGKDCLIGKDKEKVDAVIMASTSMPFLDRANAGILATALNLRSNISSTDITSTQKAGTTAVVNAIEMVKGKDKKNVLVVASDKRTTKASWFHEMWFGDGAASFIMGDEDVIAECLGTYSVTYDFVDHYRGANEKYDYNWEERWIRDEGYLKIIPEAINGVLDKTGLKIGDIKKLCYPCFLGRAHGMVAGKVGASPEQVAGNMHAETGECGVAHALILFMRELETASPGDKLLMAGFGQGSDAIIFEVTDKIKETWPKGPGWPVILRTKKPRRPIPSGSSSMN